MIGFVVGFILGGLVGMAIMCCTKINERDA